MELELTHSVAIDIIYLQKKKRKNACKTKCIGQHRLIYPIKIIAIFLMDQVPRINRLIYPIKINGLGSQNKQKQLTIDANLCLLATRIFYRQKQKGIIKCCCLHNSIITHLFGKPDTYVGRQGVPEQLSLSAAQCSQHLS